MDILKRLRESVHWLVSHTSNVPTKHIQVMDDAWNEIARLRAIEQAASDVAKQWFTDKRGMQWSIDNLVKALEAKP